jgi:hypothetical protein
VLPAGLTLNTTTGVISGTPTVEQTATEYTITASNSGGCTTVVISITINPGWNIVGGSEIFRCSQFFGNYPVPIYVFNNSGVPIPYIAFSNRKNANKCNVKKFNGIAWESVGVADFTPGSASDISLFIYNNNGNAIPYVAFSDGSVAGKMTVMKYYGGSWSTIKGYGITPGAVSSISLDIVNTGSNPSLYVAFRDNANSNKLSAITSDEVANWEYLSVPGVSPGSANSITIKVFNNSGSIFPFVAFSDEANSGRPSLLKYDGVNWQSCGSISSKPSYKISLDVINDNGMPSAYISYHNYDAFDNGIYVKRYKEGSWLTIGSKINLACGNIAYTSIAVYNNGTIVPYIFYSSSGACTSGVRKFDGSSWIALGSLYNSVAYENPSLFIYNKNGVAVPYISYWFQEAINTGVGTWDSAVYVQKYE